MDMEELKSAEVITGGFPCQDISFAGDGAGLTGERSGLWWQFRRTIRMVRPQFALLENVAALLNRGMGTVLGSLASIGYDAEWDCIPASAVGAPHERDRAWIIATDPAQKRQSKKRQLRHQQSKKRISCRSEENVFTNDRKERIQRFFPEKICRQPEFSWCEDVRGIEDLRDRPDLPPPLFCGARDGIPNWVDRVGSPGNAVVPAIPKILGNAILESISNDT